MDTENGTVGTARGNTKTRAYCITINNFTDNDTEYIVDNVDKYIYQIEKGENGTIHLQGLLYYNNAISFNSLKKKLPTTHIEKCKDLKASVKYCSKSDTRISGPFIKGFIIPKPIKCLSNDQLYKWQTSLKNLLISNFDDDRKIYSLVDKVGNVGKTAFCKYMVMNFNCCYISCGKAADIKYTIANWENKDNLIVLYDIPRSQEAYICYQSIEEVKNGIFLANKYESSMCVFNSPVVCIFSNFHLNYSKLSQDRWVHYKVNNNELIISPVE